MTGLVQDLLQEQLGAFVLRMLEERLGFIDLHNLSVSHEDDAVCHLPRKAHFMGHHQHGDAIT